MNKWIKALWWTGLLLPCFLHAQSDPGESCRVEDGRLIFTLDTRWNARQRDQVVKLFDLDSALVADVIKGKTPPAGGSVKWSVKKLDANRIELSKPLQSITGGDPGAQDVTLLDDRWIEPSGLLERESVPYGMNFFTRVQSFSYHKGIARFFLPGHLDADEVFISGSFNGWSTTNAPMQKTDSGWIARIQLKPGKYLYKYILDGNWTADPHNRQWEDDTYGERNSVVFCYNHYFYLRGCPDARKVSVAGSFNDWNIQNIPLRKVPGGWIRALYLREGTHAYKFNIELHWILDPENKVVRDNGQGYMNNYVSIGDTFYFRLADHSAIHQVYVAGDFNAWNPVELPMTKVEGGWELPYVLRPGNYSYKFILDGRWITDPANPYSTGEGKAQNSYLPIKPNHLFTLDKYPDAGTVIVTGSFNNWNTNEYRMTKQGGKWVFPIRLNPGKYTYKFIVDGEWLVDPNNNLWEENQYRTGNSVLWIEM